MDTQTHRGGQYLRYEREKQDISIEEVAGQLRLSTETVKNIEEGNCDNLLEPVYIRGHVRSYCALLGIDPAPVLKLFSNQPQSDRDHSGTRSMPPLVDEHTQYLIRVWGSIFVLAIVGFVLVARWAERESFSGIFDQVEEPAAAVEERNMQPVVEPSQTAETPEVDFSGTETPLQATQTAVTVGSSNSTAEAPGVIVTITTSGASWARIYGEDNKNIVHRILPPGYRKEFTLRLPLHLELGDVRNVRLWLNDVEYDLTRHSSSLNTAFFSIDRLPPAE